MGFEKWVRMLIGKISARPFALMTSITCHAAFFRRRRLVSNTDRFAGGTRMAHVRVIRGVPTVRRSLPSTPISIRLLSPVGMSANGLNPAIPM
jgi:hypothetical protein